VTVIGPCRSPPHRPCHDHRRFSVTFYLVPYVGLVHHLDYSSPALSCFGGGPPHCITQHWPRISMPALIQPGGCASAASPPGEIVIVQHGELQAHPLG